MNRKQSDEYAIDNQDSKECCSEYASNNNKHSEICRHSLKYGIHL